MELDDPEVKEAYRLFWLVKGGLHANHNTIMESANGYFKRVWYDLEGEDMSIWLEGFEEEYARIKKKRCMDSDQ